jgi:hypothetical protein
MNAGDPNRMTPPLLTRLFELLCRHEFSWPHTGAKGQDYQVCLICGAAYEFDCATMSRTGRHATLPAARRVPLSPSTPV